MSIFNNNILAGAAAQSGTTTHTIDQSIRFNADDSAYMYRTFGTPTDANKWTLSVWSKLAPLTRFLEAGGSSGSEDLISVGSNNPATANTYFWKRTSSSYNYNLTSTQLFRDESAFYHFVYVFDSSNAISTERMKIYVNGQRMTDFSTETYPSLNYASRINTAVEHRIGRNVYASPAFYSDGYIAEMVFIDGQALDPSSFGEYNSSNIWVPKDVSGLTFGNNGFHLKGENSSNLGSDSSGNGNDFTTSGLAAHDQMADSPTNNFCTINPPADINSTQNTISEGNLKSAGSSSTIWHISPCTQILPSGKWYFEARLNTTSGNSRFAIGLIPTSPMLTANYGNLPSSVVNSSGFSLQLDSNSQGLLWYEYSSGSGQFVTISVDTDEVGTIGQLAIDVDNQKIWAGINGTYYNSSGGGDGNPSTGTNPTYSGTSNFSTGPLVPFIGNYYNSCQGVLNFGQDGTFAGTETAQGNSDGNGIGNFKYSVPSGFLAICTKNLGR